MKKLIPCEVKEDDLDRMMEVLAQDPLFEHYKDVYTRVYVRTIMAQTKNGKQRTFEYSLEKIKACLTNLEALKLGEFLQSVSPQLLQNPIMYAAGRDNEGRRIIIIDWRRVERKNLDIEAVTKLALVCFVGYSANETAPFNLYITLAHKLKLGVKEVPLAYRLIRSISKTSMLCFPDGSCGTYHFVPGKLVPIVEFAKRLIPKRAVYKQRVGSYRQLKSELSTCCDNLDDVLPEDLGGNSVHIEENIHVTLLPNGRFQTRVLASENSNRRIVVE